MPGFWHTASVAGVRWLPGTVPLEERVSNRHVNQETNRGDRLRRARSGRRDGGEDESGPAGLFHPAGPVVGVSLLARLTGLFDICLVYPALETGVVRVPA